MVVTKRAVVADKAGVLKALQGQDLFASVNQIVDPSGVSGSLSEDEEEISMEEVGHKVRKLKAGKSAGVDEIRTEELTMKSSAVPADWCYAVIAPIYKKGNRKECGNYRGIFLLSVVGKLYASVLVD